MERFYPIGTPGKPWQATHRAHWRARQTRQRSYDRDVCEALEPLRAQWHVQTYGTVVYDTQRYPLYALRSPDWDAARPTVLVTGGVHGYETSGVLGALAFARAHA